MGCCKLLRDGAWLRQWRSAREDITIDILRWTHDADVQFPTLRMYSGQLTREEDKEQVAAKGYNDL